MDITNPNLKIARFRFDRATKNTLKYEEVEVNDAPKIIGSLYIQKSALQGQPLEVIISIEVAE